VNYFDELCGAMRMLAHHPGAIFMGQAVAFKGTAMYGTLRDVPEDRRLELPVAEDMQMGIATGMALSGLLPVCLFPRWNFLLLAANQLVLHLDKLPAMSAGGFEPKVIVRTAIATREPLDPGPQHLGDFTDMIRPMLANVRVVKLSQPADVLREYHAALARDGSTVLVEHMELYS
jgi:pyruvate/2-oxoglutarate/acetoin dehydrogenase E1 component